MSLRTWGLASSLLLAACTRPCELRCASPCEPAAGSVESDLATPEAVADAAELDEALADVGTADGAEARALDLARRRWTEGRLRPALGLLAERFVAAHPAMARRGVDVDRVVAFVGAQLWLLGKHPTIPSVAVPSWDELAREHAATVAASVVPRERRSLVSAGLLVELGNAAGAPWTYGNAVEVLVDGPASWAVRERLLGAATGELFVASWAVYDDRTGREAVDALLARAAAGTRVHLVVDGQTAALPPYDDEVARLDAEARRRDLPVEVTRWRDPARPFDGMHWKLLIARDPIAGDTMVLGGMNFGDVYSHKDREPGRGWRDTDVVVRGPAVEQARARFDGRFRRRPRPVRDVAPAGDEQVAVVTHAPGGADPILRSLLVAIDGARRAIDLENAYVVRIPSVEQALVAAVARNVRVRVLTNSLESCDEPVVAQAIARSVGMLADAGVEVWLRRGSTLHSKFAAIDGVFAQVGSYNLHPRSHRLEHEIAVNVLGARTAKRLHEVFDADLAAATRVPSSADLPALTDPVGRLAWLLCRDLL